MEQTNTSTNAILETLATVLMAVATVATAWCAYQSTVFGSVQEFDLHQADVLNREINAARNRGFQRSMIDVQLFTNWANAYGTQQSNLADYYETLFTPRMKPAFDAWLKLDPANNPEAPRHFFFMKEYVVPDDVAADSLQIVYDERVQMARDSNAHSEHYILLTVIFASVLFFGGITSNIQSTKTKTALVVGSSALLVGSIIWMLTFPMILR